MVVVVLPHFRFIRLAIARKTNVAALYAMTMLLSTRAPMFLSVLSFFIGFSKNSSSQY